MTILGRPTTTTFALAGCGAFASAVLDGNSSVNDAQGVVITAVNGTTLLPPGTAASFNSTCAVLQAVTPRVENASRPGLPRLDFTIPSVPLSLFDNTASIFPPGFDGTAEMPVSNLSLTFVNQATFLVTGTFSPEIVAIQDPVTLAVDPLNVNILWSIRGDAVAPLVDGPTTATFSLDSCGLFATAELDGDSSVDDAQGVVVTAVNGGTPLPPVMPAFFNGNCADLEPLTPLVANASRRRLPRLDVLIPAVPLSLFDTTVFAPGFGSTTEQVVENISLTFVNQATFLVTGSFSPEIIAITDPVTLAVDPLNVDILWSIRGADVTPLVEGLTTATFSLDGCGMFAIAELTGNSSINDAQDVVFNTVNGDPPLTLPGSTGNPKEPLSHFLRGECDDDGVVNLTDALCSLNSLFSSRRAGCIMTLNANGDAKVDIADPIWLLSYLFAGGRPPATPFPACGPSALATDDHLGCETPPTMCN